jgi:hypothetical protein
MSSVAEIFTNLYITSSCSPASGLYAGSDFVEIWLGVRRLRRGRLVRGGFALLVPVAGVVDAF